MKFRQRSITLALAGLALFGAQAVSAGPASGDTIVVHDTVGRVGNGGPFGITGGSYSGPSFNTFCVEENEFLSFGSTYTVTLSTGAVKGGIGILHTYDGDVDGTGTFDPLSKASAWLYTQYLTGGADLTGYINSGANNGDIQNAIWFLENEITSVSGDALTWKNLAVGAAPTFTGAGRIGVMNLTSADGNDQSLLSPIPEPETYAMLLAGLGLMGFMARRRKLNAAA